MMGDYRFKNWGSHSNSFPCSYLTAAAAIGLTKDEVDTLIKRLDKVFTKFKRKTVPSPLESRDNRNLDVVNSNENSSNKDRGECSDSNEIREEKDGNVLQT